MAKKTKKSDWEIFPEAQEGNIINDNMGQWKYPGEITRIKGNIMATHGYGNIPLYVIPNKGEPKLVLPNTGIHEFKGADSFTEYPIMQAGGRITPEERRILKKQRDIASKSKYEIIPDSPADIPASLEKIDYYNWLDANKEYQKYGSPEEYYQRFPDENTFELFQSKWRGADLGSSRRYISQDEAMMQNGGLYNTGGELPQAGSGYKVVRSSERKGKTHKVTGPDGTVKFFGDSKLGQHPKDPKRKKAFYARHAKNLKNNPYFRAFARKTWEEGGMLPDLMEMAAGGQFLTVGGEHHRIYKNADGDIMVNHHKEDKGKWDTINLTDKAGAKTVADGVAATKKWHRENPYAFGGNVILERYGDGGSNWEIVPDTEWEII